MRRAGTAFNPALCPPHSTAYMSPGSVSGSCVPDTGYCKDCKTGLMYWNGDYVGCPVCASAVEQYSGAANRVDPRRRQNIVGVTPADVASAAWTVTQLALFAAAGASLGIAIASQQKDQPVLRNAAIGAVALPILAVL